MTTLNNIETSDKRKAIIEKIENLRRSKLSDIAVEHIIEGIKSATYLPGQKISPNVVARELNISIMPVRDAIERLEQQGWIVRYAQKGTYVRKIRLSKMYDMIQVRAMIESEAIFRIIEQNKTNDLEQLNECVRLNEQAASNKDIEEYERTDTLFHKTLVSATHNKILIDMHSEILEQLGYMFHIVVLCSEKIKKHEIMDLSKIPVSHKSIYEAIASKDLTQSVKLIHSHLEKAMERFDKMIKMRNLDKSNFFES